MDPIENIAAECNDERPDIRPVWGLDVVCVHRITFPGVPAPEVYETLDLVYRRQLAIEIARRFVDDPEVAAYTGGELAYTWLVDPAGTWWTCLALSDTGRHARRHNADAIGVGAVGDFTKHRPTVAQRDSLIDGLSYVCPSLVMEPVRGLTTWLRGHDELPGASKDPNKRCPGEYLPMTEVRTDVHNLITARAQQYLLTNGLVL